MSRQVEENEQAETARRYSGLIHFRAMVARVQTTADGLSVTLHLPQNAIAAATDLMWAKVRGQLLDVVANPREYQLPMKGPLYDTGATGGRANGDSD